MTPQDVSRDLFERRMRQRRAATCVAAARTSLADGRSLEAVERLEEACRLDPEALEARLLLEQIRAEEEEVVELPDLTRSEPPPVAGFGKWSHWVAAVIAVVALAALALLRQPATEESLTAPAPDRAQPAISAEAPASADLNPAARPGVGEPGDTVPLVIQPAGPVASVAPDPSGSQGGRGEAVGTAGSGRPKPTAENRGVPATAERGDTAAAAAERPDTPPPAATTVAALPAPTGGSAGAATAGVALPPPSDRPAVVGAVEGEAPQVAGGRGISEPLPGVPPPPAGSTASARREVPAAPRPADPAPASYRVPAAEEEIGRTLRLYAEAYERLDASAARKVWPSVDERALARAFAGLESQGISFERCETEVDGPEARAVCRGQARYVPKVGNREPLTAARQWTFRLRRAGDGWQIATAEVR